MTTTDVLREEMESIVKDLRRAYEDSGKKVSGEWGEGLQISSSPNRVVLEGYTYLAGRAAGKQPPIQNILEWVEARGIKPIEENITTSGLAWAIAKKIAREGTNKESSLKIYEEVITPQRIDAIIKKVTEFNVQLFVNEITVELKHLEKNI